MLHSGEEGRSKGNKSFTHCSSSFLKMVNSRSLLLLVCTVLLVGAISGSDARRQRGPCCVAVTKGNMTPEVVGETYREHAARGHCVKAIIFNTKHGQLCADPNAQWVKDLIVRMTRV